MSSNATTTPNQPEVPTYLTVGEVAREMRVSERTAWRWIRRGVETRSGDVVRLAAVKAGLAWRVSRKALDEFCRECAGR